MCLTSLCEQLSLYMLTYCIYVIHQSSLRKNKKIKHVITFQAEGACSSPLPPFVIQIYDILNTQEPFEALGPLMAPLSLLPPISEGYWVN